MISTSHGGGCSPGQVRHRRGPATPCSELIMLPRIRRAIGPCDRVTSARKHVSYHADLIMNSIGSVLPGKSGADAETRTPNLPLPTRRATPWRSRMAWLGRVTPLHRGHQGRCHVPTWRGHYGDQAGGSRLCTGLVGAGVPDCGRERQQNCPVSKALSGPGDHPRRPVGLTPLPRGEG